MLRVGVLVMDRGGSDVTLDYARANSSMPRPLEHAKAARARGRVRSSPRAQVSTRLEKARVQH